MNSTQRDEKEAPRDEKEAFKARYIKYKFINTSQFFVKAKKLLNAGIWQILFKQYAINNHEMSSEGEEELIAPMEVMEGNVPDIRESDTPILEEAIEEEDDNTDRFFKHFSTCEHHQKQRRHDQHQCKKNTDKEEKSDTNH